MKNAASPDDAPLISGLYLVATPIGNRDDITSRALETLRRVDAIACEDTRKTGQLLAHYGIEKPLVSYHEHNEKARSEALKERILAGSSLALVSDAGTPAISDPGFRLVRACRKAGIPVVPLPGPCALITALSASGLPTHSFLYAGFLPPKASQRIKFFNTHKDATYSLVCYESSHRIDKFINDAIDTFGKNRTGCVARELTKRFETFLVGTLESIANQLTGSQLKGEFVVIVAPASYQL